MVPRSSPALWRGPFMRGGGKSRERGGKEERGDQNKSRTLGAAHRGRGGKDAKNLVPPCSGPNKNESRGKDK